MASTFHWADYIVFSAFIVVSLAIGVFYSCTGGKQKTNSEYLLADRKLHCLPTSLSLMVTFTSCITLLGFTAEMYTGGSQFWLYCVGVSLAALAAERIFIPLLYPLHLTSTYEYLDRRFKSKIARQSCMLMGTISFVFLEGVVMYAPSIALEAVTGLPTWASILIMAAAATFYTTLGGIKAVIWTDVFQFLIMLIGMIIALAMGCIRVGGFSNMWELCQRGGRIQSFDFDFNPLTRHTFWGLTIGIGTTWVYLYGVSQPGVQRFSATPSLRDARSTVLLVVPVVCAIYALNALVGLTVFAYYSHIQCDPMASGAVTNQNQIFPHFVMDVLGVPGVPGIFLAAMFSAALSTISSALNSLAANIWEDFLKDRFPNTTPARATHVTKALVIASGMLSTVMAFIAMMIPGQILQVTLALVGAAGGAIVGMYSLGAFTSSCNWKGAVVGGWVSLAFVLWISAGAFSIKSTKHILPPASTNGCYFGNISDIWNETNTTPDYTREYQTGLSNISIVPTEQVAVEGPLYKFYSISYTWYGLIGIIVAFTTGMLVSLITGLSDKDDVDEETYIKWPDLVFCCLPESCRARLWSKITGSQNLDNKDGDPYGLKENAEPVEMESLVAQNGIKT
ncbi:unnamed protein product [Owenia fusiformis]|uniref:Uncharacterized protein n=1 Tax=Owenia fusiformis TaxID=6347 RepID=A0A8J1Y1Z4_OWEFU|nr:unnamed protein product [Owenia fusiformis]